MHRTSTLLAGGLVGLLATLTFLPSHPSPTEANGVVQSLPEARLVLDVPRDTTSALPAGEAELSVDVVSGQRLVRLTDPDDLHDVVDRYDLEVLREPGRSGFALLAGAPDALVAMTQDPQVASSSANAVIRGASGGASPGYTHLQWHLDRMQVPAQPPLGDQVVAVLDSGVAYETAVRYGVAYTQASSLSSSPIVAPYDFINDDPHANDDHQHGTHIASIIASSGDVRGVAPGVALMPLKVLDAENQGHELALVEALWHAIDHGADVINLSLSFGHGYRPSVALQEALQAAHDAEIVLVGAAGNRGSDAVTWPAASPHVIAVGAGHLVDDDDELYAGQSVAPYSNVSAAIDILAPGGNITADLDADGLPDGILAEAIDPANPSSTGLWVMAGTSQAAGMISGLAATLLANGVAPHDVAATLQYNGKQGDPAKGQGTGFIDIWNTTPQGGTVPPGEDFHVTILPFLADEDDGDVAPRARVTVFQDDGSLALGVHVFATLTGNADGVVQCWTGDDGTCILYGESIPSTDSAGQPSVFAWSYTVEAVSRDTWIFHRPSVAMTSHPGLDALVGGLRADEQLKDALLAWSWASGWDDDLGHVANGFGLSNNGSGLASLPLGVVLTPGAVNILGSLTASSVDANGVAVPVTALDLDGSGLASIPLGITLSQLRIAFIDGTGLASLPLGFRPIDAHGGSGTLLRLNGEPSVITGTHLAAQIAAGGWRADGYDAASLIGSSTTLGILPAAAHPYAGSGHGAAPADLP